MKNNENEIDGVPSVNIGRIGYVNVDPIYYGLEHKGKPNWMRIVDAPPAELNRQLASGALDISAISAVAYTRHQDDWLLLPELCIACAGDVMSVLLASRYPMQALTGKRIHVTDESATAASLIRLVLKMKQVSPVYETGKILTPGDVRETDGAALIIGDTAMRGNWHDAFPYVWDLGDLWSKLTGLPFVFALWAVRKSFAKTHPEIVTTVLKMFRDSKKIGMRHVDEIAASASNRLGIARSICKQYFDNFCYDLKASQIKGLTAFFHHLYTEGFFSDPINLFFFGEH